MTINPGDTIGPYEIRERLGEGGMASVYKAWHTGLHRFEALKIPRGGGSSDSAYVQRLLTEARLAAGLRHPHIVAIHNVSDPSSTVPYFAMEWINGRDLSALLQERGRLDWEETVAILEPVAQALDYAHERGVIHRDIKPANILLQQAADGQPLAPKVVDFGISRAAGEDDGATRLTRSGMLVGTPEYMSPEQSGSGEPVEHHTDIYSLGVLAYEMLCGKPPFTAGEGVSRLAILIQHVRDLPAPASLHCTALPAGVAEVLGTALAKSTGDRYPTCSAFIAALKSAGKTEVAAPLSRDVSGTEPDSGPSFPTLAVDSGVLAAGLVAAGAASEGPDVVPQAAPTFEITPFDATGFAIQDTATLAERPPQGFLDAPQAVTRQEDSRHATHIGTPGPIATLSPSAGQPTLGGSPLARQRPAVPARVEPVKAEPAEAAPAVAVQPPLEEPPTEGLDAVDNSTTAPGSRNGVAAGHSASRAGDALERSALPRSRRGEASQTNHHALRSSVLAGFAGVLAGAILVYLLIARTYTAAPEQTNRSISNPSHLGPAGAGGRSPVPPPLAAPAPRIVRQTRFVSVPFATETRASAGKPQGSSLVLRPGQPGRRLETVAITYAGTREVSRKVESRKIVTAPVAQIVVQGTAPAPSPATNGTLGGSAPAKPRSRAQERRREWRRQGAAWPKRAKADYSGRTSRPSPVRRAPHRPSHYEAPLPP